MTLKCFVAMAFGREDTDQVYDKLIAPTLRKHKIQPIRVDRIEHNDDIDKRIMAELSTCDLALADLTYARPSVYFEAGFAQRAVPVVYTCRRDHFIPRAEDPEGNVRVHFDLQMRNIVAWQNSRDRSFVDKLGKRIAHVITPILRVKEIDRVAQEDAKHFAALSTEEKTRCLLDICAPQLQRARYSAIPKQAWEWRYQPKGEWDRKGIAKQHKFQSFVEPIWLGVKAERSTIKFAMALVVPSLTKSVFNSLKEFILTFPIYNINPRGLGKPRQIVEHLFLCSMQGVLYSTVMSNLPNFHSAPEPKTFVWSGMQSIVIGPITKESEIYSGHGSYGRFAIRKGNSIEWLRDLGDRITQRYDHKGRVIGRVKTIPRTIYIHILDNVKSEPQFKTMMRNALERME